MLIMLYTATTNSKFEWIIFFIDLQKYIITTKWKKMLWDRFHEICTGIQAFKSDI